MIDEMDDMSVFRRFFVASEMIRELLTQGGLRQPSFSGSQVTPPVTGAGTEPATVEDQSVPPHLGGHMAPIAGTRPTRTSRKSETRRRDSAPSDSYKFPS